MFSQQMLKLAHGIESNPIWGSGRFGIAMMDINVKGLLYVTKANRAGMCRPQIRNE